MPKVDVYDAGGIKVSSQKPRSGNKKWYKDVGMSLYHFYQSDVFTVTADLGV